MQISINGEPQEIASGETVATMTARFGYHLPSIAVAVNEQCIPRSFYQETKLNEGDRVEILAPMAGG